jgi:16S rRNA (guanine527-N7)-methyltransferase
LPHNCGYANLHAQHATGRAVAGDAVPSHHLARICVTRGFVRLDPAAAAADGGWMAMKGKKPTDELAALDPSVLMFHVEQLTVPGLEAERCLVWMQPTPSL